MAHIASTIVLVLITLGIYWRRNRVRHLRLMIAAFLLDLAILAYVEVTRHAIDRVATRATLLVWFHVTVSVLVLSAYAVQIVLGSRLLSGLAINRAQHMWMGIAFCGLRLTNYVTSWML